MTTWTKDIPSEEGYYFIRWHWWPATTEEVACVYFDEDTGQAFISRFNVCDKALPLNPPCEFSVERITSIPITPPSEEKQ